MQSRFVALAAILATAFASPVGASLLYKSVDANGTVTFSDIPPPPGSRLLEQRIIGAPESSSAAASPASPAGLEDTFQTLDYDRALAEANLRLDLAEHALALARSGHAPTPRPSLVSLRPSSADEQRVEFYKRDLRVARQALIDLLRSRQLASGR